MSRTERLSGAWFSRLAQDQSFELDFSSPSLSLPLGVLLASMG